MHPGFVPDATRNVVSFDVESQHLKIAHCEKFDEGVNVSQVAEFKVWQVS